MRKCLRNLLSHEKSLDRSFSYTPDNTPFEVEKKEIGDKISEIKSLVPEYANEQGTSLRKKLGTKLIHILGRVDRLSATDSDISQARSNFLQTIINLESDFKEMKNTDTIQADDKLVMAAVNFEQEM